MPVLNSIKDKAAEKSQFSQLKLGKLVELRVKNLFVGENQHRNALQLLLLQQLRQLLQI